MNAPALRSPGLRTPSFRILWLVAAIWLPVVSRGQLVPFKNPTPAANDQFGRAVAGLGVDRVLIGAPMDDRSAADGGSAYLFNTNGTLLATFANPNPSTTDYFGFTLASVGDDRVVVGAYLEDQGILDSGRAYLFNTNGLLVTTFANPTPAELDFFGYAIAAAGNDRVLISAYQDDAWATDSGSAYLFNTDGTLLTTFVNPTPATGDSFGWSLAAIGAGQVIVGAHLDDGASMDVGAAYLFRTDGTLITTLIKPAPRRGDRFGWSVAAVGEDRVLVGAPFDDTGKVDAGAAYLFDLEGRLLATIRNPRPVIADAFGSALAGVGTDGFLVGAYLYDTGDVQRDAGAVYLFDTDGKLVRTIENPTPKAQDFLGISIARVGLHHAIVGAHYGDTGGNNTGAAFLISVGSE